MQGGEIEPGYVEETARLGEKSTDAGAAPCKKGVRRARSAQGALLTVHEDE